MVLLLLLFAIATVQAQNDAQFYSANTRLGKVNGTIEYTPEGKQVTIFRGIPFGKAPVGEKRFKHSEAYGAWRGTLNATQFSAACMQKKGWSFGFIENERESEDCLYLNVFVPGTNIDNNTPKAVMVWIYGGGLVLGSAETYDARSLADNGDVIVVTINYRVGLFGFLTTGDDIIPGNMGIGDQILALKWVQDNIMDYGGDNSRVTIFGESAGSWSVSILAASPKAAGLFHRAILQSGAIMHTTHRRDVAHIAYNASASVGCRDVWSSNEILSCMKDVSSDLIISLDPFTFMSSVHVDDDILPMQPEEIWKQGKQNDVEIMIGVTSADGLILLNMLYPTQEFFQTGLDETAISTLIWYGMENTIYDNNCSSANDIISDYYFGGNYYDYAKNLESAIDMVTDFSFLVPSVQLSRYALKHDQDVYWFYFDQPPKPDTPAGKAIIDIGANHGDELWYVFGWYLGYGSENDIALTHSMMRAWSSFAKTGEPMWIDKYGMDQEWPQYTWEDARYLKFRDNLDPDMNIEEWTMEARADFWLDTLPKCQDVKASGAQRLGVFNVILLPILAMMHMLKA